MLPFNRFPRFPEQRLSDPLSGSEVHPERSAADQELLWRADPDAEKAVSEWGMLGNHASIVGRESFRVNMKYHVILHRLT